MNCLSFHSSPNPLISTISRLHRPTGVLTIRNAVPARDRVIEFGKYKGKMLGTLPSNYLKWVSKNLRARDFEDWAKLADEVLDDLVYRDRVEWEFAQKVLNGDVSSAKMFQNGAVSELLEISERFGWDNEDKVGWAKIDFGLLGTSKGGRIPRVSPTGPRRNKDAGLEIGKPKIVKNGPSGERRRERRERLKQVRYIYNNGAEDGEKLGINLNEKVNFGNSSEVKLERKEDEKIRKSVFPGREAFLKKGLNLRGEGRKK